MNKITKKQASIEAVLRSGHANAEGQLPVRIRVTYDRKARYYPVFVDGKPLYVKPAQWAKLSRVLKSEVDKAKAKAIVARDNITRGRVFSFDRFEQEFLHQESEKGILYLFERYLEGLLREGRVGSHISYGCAYNAFNRFRGGKSQNKVKKQPFVRGREIKPEDLTVDVLKRFDEWLRKQGLNKTSIAIYMRSLKVIYNLAIDANPALAEFYPFAKKANDTRRYKIRTGSGKKGQAMSADQLQRFIATTPEVGGPEWEAKQYWLFMFYASGMNMADVAQLRYRDVQWDAIRYVRAKTRDTESAEEVIEIPLSDSLKKIILAIGSPDKSPDAYVFPILSPGMSPEKIKAVTQQKTKWVNKWLARLCEANELPVITTYWSRHTAASLLRESGVDVEMISELLGHSDPKVTREYLKRFSVQTKQAAIESAMQIIKTA
jgi:integrase/recombinase XerD